MNKFIAGLLLSVGASAAAAPSNDDMARCAAIAAPDSRLACYDALAHRPADKVSRATVPPASAAPTPAAVATTSTAAPAAAAAASQAPAAVPNPADPKNFGLTAAQQHTSDLGPKSIAAHISSVSSGQIGQTFVVLDSGQTWTVLDNDGRLSAGDAVTIKRAALGSFLMVTPSNHSYRVRRIR
ncbi:MAG TPA: hypothetical protein VGI90_01100 [Steroidobacteraceae bacterium]|jgi:hypothetical protein